MAEGSQGPRTYKFSVQQVRVTRRRKPGETLWAIYRGHLDASEPRYYLSNAPEDTPLVLQRRLYGGGSDLALRRAERRLRWERAARSLRS